MNQISDHWSEIIQYIAIYSADDERVAVNSLYKKQSILIPTATSNYKTVTKFKSTKAGVANQL